MSGEGEGLAPSWVARYQHAHPTQTETLSSDLLHYEIGRLMRQMTNWKHRHGLPVSH